MNEMSQNSIIDMLVLHEELLARLYAICRAQYPDGADFWHALVVEEKAHAQVLRELEIILKTEQVLLNPRKFNNAGVQTSLEHVNKIIADIQTGNITHRRAVALALDTERAIIECEFFRLFDTDSAAMKREFEELRKHTAQHIERIVRKLAELTSA